MAKRQRNTAVEATVEAAAIPAVEATVEAVVPAVEAPVAAAVRTTLRLPLPQAKVHNAQHVLLASGQPVVAANVALTSKGTNPKKVKVYGYDNLGNGGGVPKAAIVVLVPGATSGTTPKGCNDGQWQRLVELASAGNVTVAYLYDNNVASRTVRRAYRAGAIRFLGQAAQDAANAVAE